MTWFETSVKYDDIYFNLLYAVLITLMYHNHIMELFLVGAKAEIEPSNTSS